MKILYDHQVFSRQSAGGASRYFCELARQLSATGQVDLEMLVGAYASVYSLEELASPHIHVWALSGIRLPGFGNYLINEAIGNCAAPFLGRMDVYHPTLYRAMPGVRARRIVATHHDCTQERFPQDFRHVDKVRRAKKSLYARADAIICVSEWCRAELLDIYDIDASKTHVVHHGFTHLPRMQNAREKIQRKVRREFLLYVGSRARYKNFDGLLTAFRDTGLHHSFDLLAIGGGEFSDEENLNLAKLELQNCVFVFPSAADALLAAAYAGARLFIYPSLSEGFGLPPLEAMSLDCPVLASRSSCIPEICGDAPFYFNPMDQDSFNRELLRAVSDEEARDQAVKRGRGAITRYSWEECGMKTLSVYRQCQ